ncbi:MAG: DUF3422 domain-containing protein [Betaproteobacteria bacterium]
MTTVTVLPADDTQRELLHNEIHARPTARIRLPALVVYVAVLNEGISREQESEHLRRLPGQEHLRAEQLTGNFLRLRFATHTVKWERHTEFTRYSIVQHLPEHAYLGASRPELLSELMVSPAWLAAIPGRTIAAIKLVMTHGDLTMPEETMALARHWFGDAPVVASVVGNTGHSWAVTDFMVGPSGFERMLVLTPSGTSPTRAGRLSQRLLEIETYRLMALRGLPVAKQLSPVLAQAETQLLDITAQLEGRKSSARELLEQLVGLATRIERATAEHAYRFSATRAYDALVQQRLVELRERPLAGTQTIGEFLQRRLSPAMATVAATGQRLSSLAGRITRASALLRTQVDIATEEQNHQLLAKLTRGQDLQLRLQITVEGLSIAAISYYVIGLLLYLAKALHGLGLPVHPEIAVGAAVPVVLWAVWRTTRRIHQALHKDKGV